jgi:hypothetical protein
VLGEATDGTCFVPLRAKWSSVTTASYLAGRGLYMGELTRGTATPYLITYPKPSPLICSSAGSISLQVHEAMSKGIPPVVRVSSAGWDSKLQR